VVEAFSLDANGDLNISKNGVIRVLTGTSSDIQSALMLIANKKGSYAFIQDLGLDERIIFNYTVEGQRQEDTIADIAEQLIKMELQKDPNIATVTNFQYERVTGTRKLSLTFDATISGTAQTISNVVIG
jgi:hypothetical protein